MSARDGFVVRWTRCYTAGLPEGVRDERRAEIASDVYEHLAAAGNLSSSAAQREMLWRTIRGMPDDITWRLREARRMDASAAGASLLRTAWSTATQAWFAPVAVLMGAFNLLLGIGIVFNGGGDNTMPGRVIGPMFLAAFAAATFIGLRKRWTALRTPIAAVATDQAPGSRAGAASRYGVVLCVLAVLATVVFVWGGGAGRAPVLAIAGLALAAGAFGLSGRRRGRPAANAPGAEKVGDALLVLGALPGLAFFWMIVPPILAIIVIAGALGVGPSGRRPEPA